eukprot:GFKZ01008698.1.p1 GENE.GFKZ01008698.1~~GFKZ01008698.1.p1  ORF type:complete len:598 (+),score=63.76 GFKZ01008698.1:594-2387(+)
MNFPLTNLSFGGHSPFLPYWETNPSKISPPNPARSDSLGSLPSQSHQTCGMSYHAALRSHRVFGRRRRQDSLPQASLLFLLATAILAVWFAGPSSRKPPFDPANPLVNLATTRVSTSYGDLCASGFRSQLWLLALLIPGVVFLFVGLAIITDDYFVAALERICERLKLSEDVAGATFMAAGSSTPEFFASLLGVFVTEDTVGVGTIVGSAVFNILVIIGLSAALAGAVLHLDWRPLARDSFFYVVSIILLLVFVLWSTPGRIDWWEGLILVVTYILYVMFMAFLNKRYMKLTAKLTSRREEAADDKDIETGDCPQSAETPTADCGNEAAVDSAVAASAEQKPNYHMLNPRSQFRTAQFAIIAAHRFASSSSSGNSGEDSDDDEEEDSNRRKLLGVDLPTSIVGWIFFPLNFFWKLLFSVLIVDCSRDDRAHLWWLTFLMSIVLISGISYLMVEAARLAGCLIGIPATAMGLTVLAAGTSVPDALASVSVARGGAGDMAVSNAIGSNVFDILLGLGFPWFIGDLAKRGEILVPIDPLATVVVPIVILFGILVFLLATLVILRWKLRPLLGIILFALYGVFVAYTLLDVYVFKLGQAEE